MYRLLGLRLFLLPQTLLPLLLLPGVSGAADLPPAPELPQPPRDLAAYTTGFVRQFSAASNRLDQWAAEDAWQNWSPTAPTARPPEALQRLAAVLELKQRVDESLQDALVLRGGFSSAEESRQELGHYLHTLSTLIDLSGRIRYTLRDAVDETAYVCEADLREYARLVRLLRDSSSSIGGSAVSYILLDPPPESEFKPFPNSLRKEVLELYASTRSCDLLPFLTDFVRQSSIPTELLVRGVEVIRTIGLPQSPRPGQDTELPPPVIEAKELIALLTARSISNDELLERRTRLVSWLEQRANKGVVGELFRVNGFDLRAGDWLLMRNPSPYNLFTDLSPGLFTHVGIVATETDAEGVRRFVIVDLPERGDRIPATNVDTYLLRTVHYFFLRHQRDAIGQEMARIASPLIGRESQFDLNFRTRRVEGEQGLLREGAPIHTYCAGFLMLCAQETSAPMKEFFPLRELPAGGNCTANLAKLGLSIGENFVSPTGALFSPYLSLVAQRRPMYSPDREVKERIYNHFADCMVERELVPAPDTYQLLREKLAGLSKQNPLLARALAAANNVNPNMDLESAAKAAAVIETLDEFADANYEGFLEARRALQAGALEAVADQAERAGIAAYRQRHAALFQAFISNRLSPRHLRIELVDYYSSRGQRQVDDRFFQPAK